MGVSNQYAVSDAKKVFVGFPLSFYENKNESFIHAGQIIRDNIELTSGYDFGFKQNKPVVLITGGSQGSRIVNKTTLQILKKLTENFNVIHQSGRLDFLEVKKEADLLDDSIKSSYFLTEFLNLNGETDLMLSAIKEASIIVTRAGATTVAEVIAMQKPMILIPYKHAAGYHQSKNAQLLEESKAAIVLGDDQLNSEVLLEKILYLSHNKDKALNMVKNAKGHFPQNGLKIVTEAILKELE
jgi:UDP-N-acetylglucosamine--N-acetylmuramyl-(pentapeptide) pyrophosphoryl-undecaprenol N-acetylglucosamine transferase